jgi:hypothetical protein
MYYSEVSAFDRTPVSLGVQNLPQPGTEVSTAEGSIPKYAQWLILLGGAAGIILLIRYLDKLGEVQYIKWPN